MKEAPFFRQMVRGKVGPQRRDDAGDGVDRMIWRGKGAVRPSTLHRSNDQWIRNDGRQSGKSMRGPGASATRASPGSARTGPKRSIQTDSLPQRSVLAIGAGGCRSNPPPFTLTCVAPLQRSHARRTYGCVIIIVRSSPVGSGASTVISIVVQRSQQILFERLSSPAQVLLLYLPLSNCRNRCFPRIHCT